MHPAIAKWSFDLRYIPLGGLISGFFGGLSGHQGALRSAFLVRAGLDKKRFIGTAVVSAVVVDVSRLVVYGATFFSKDFQVLQRQEVVGPVIAGSFTAFCGAFIGSRLTKKITMQTIHLTVGTMLLVIGVLLAIGWV